MGVELIHKSANRRLLVVFAGWGMDASPFRGLKHDAYDIAVAWDYEQLMCHGNASQFHSLRSLSEAYDEVCVVAWSFGVYAAARLMPLLGPNVTRKIAVNGTMRPIDDACGIPEAIFDGTLANMSPRNLQKFYRRMCGSAVAYGEFAKSMPERDLDQLIAELQAFGTCRHEPGTHVDWDLAVISTEDAIFPLANQRRAWKGTPTVEIEGPHLPDLQLIINKHLIDKPLVSKRFGAAAGTYDANAEVQRRIAGDLWAQVSPLFDGSKSVIEIGCGTGQFTALYAPLMRSASWRLWDIADVRPDYPGADFEICDAELAIDRVPDGSVDYIISNCAVQWFGSPSRFLAASARILRPGGILAFSTFTNDNMPELRHALGGLSLCYPSSEEWQRMMPPSLTLEHIGRSEHTLLFDTPRAVLQHLRDTGVNALGRQPVSRLRAFDTLYPRTPVGRCPLTYKPLLIVLRKINA